VRPCRPEAGSPGHGAATTGVSPRRPFSWLAARLVGRLLFRHTPLQLALVERLRREAAALGGDSTLASDLWNGQRARLRQLLLDGDPARFLRWPPVRTTMVSRTHATAAHELAHLRARHDWRSRWRPALRETTLGGPRPLPRHPWTSAALIRHAYHVCRFEEATGRSLARMALIVEFGGGYGRLCHLLHDLGFSGTYVIFDLPEVAALQRFYLRHVGIPVWSPGDAGEPAAGLISVVDLAQLRALLGTRPAGDAAFVAVGSLSESPLALRDAVLSEVASFDAFLYLYAAREGAIDNRAYFTAWRASLGEHDWQETEVTHLGKDAWHLFGRRSSGTRGA
jgi:hypothetical protein